MEDPKEGRLNLGSYKTSQDPEDFIVSPTVVMKLHCHRAVV